MPATYTFLESAVYNRIAPDLVQTQANDNPIFQKFPIRQLNAARLRWSIKENYRGLMNLRGYDGAPTRVLRPGENLYEVNPGVFGEFGQLDEMELTERARSLPMDMTVPIDVSDMVTEWQAVLTTRLVQRMCQMAWGVALMHNLTILFPQGGPGFTESFPGQTMTVAVLWSDPMNSTPIHDLRQLQFVYGRGTSNDFQQKAEAWMNGRTAQYIMQNRNPADAGGIRGDLGATIFNSVDEFNKILLASGAPKICIFDGSPQMDTAPNTPFVNNNYAMYIPDGVVWVCAARPGGDLPGAFLYTRHMVNGGGTQPYAFVDDYTKSEPHPQVPPKIIIQQGFNGGPVQERPTQTVTMMVA